MRTIASAVVLFGTALAVAQTRHESHSNPELLQGTWIGRSAEADGLRADPELVKQALLVVKGNRAIIIAPTGMRNGEVSTMECTVTLNTRLKPNEIDLTEIGHRVEPIRGIYELKGDTLKICFGGFGDKRPEEFKAPKGSELALGVYTRERTNSREEQELNRLEGNWVALTCEGHAKSRDPLLRAKVRLFLIGDCLVRYPPAGERGDETVGDKYIMKLNPHTKPKQIDLTEAGAIYEFDGEHLRICMADIGIKRPTEFKTKKGLEWTLTILKREKALPKKKAAKPSQKGQGT
jgi:uncharacterized protein (TIGR03067 family)